MSKAKLLIVDNHPEVLRWIEKRLARNEDLDICRTTALIDVEVHLEACKPDILLIDPYMPEGLCLSSLKKYKELMPDMIVVVLAAVIDDDDRKIFSEMDIHFVLEKRLACERLVQTLNLALEITTSKKKKA